MATYDPSDAYDENLDNSHEPELDLPEGTSDEIKSKIEKEEDKRDKLVKAIDTDIGNDGNQISTQISGVPVKDKYHRVISTFEWSFDTKLKAKKQALQQDIDRLKILLLDMNTKLKAVDTALKRITKEGENVNSIIRSEAIAASAYIKRLNAGRRSKSTGRTGGTNAAKAKEGKGAG